MISLKRFTALFAVLLALALPFASFAATPIYIEQSRTHSATGSFGCTVSGATVAAPSVITCAAAHNLITGDQVQITGIGGTTTDNTLAYVLVLTSTTFSIWSDAATTASPITGTGTYTSGGAVSQAVDISGWSGDATLTVQVNTATVGDSLVCIQDSTDGFVNNILNHECIDVNTTVTTGAPLTYSWRLYQIPSLRLGTLNARIRVNVQAQVSMATINLTAWLH
jgi:hypothetical protein